MRLQLFPSHRLLAVLIVALAAAAGRAQTYGYSTFAGRAVIGSDDGAAADARFDFPQGVAADGSGNLYVADTNNHTIRKITADRVVTTIAGAAGFPGKVDGMGAAARFSYPCAVAVDRDGNLFVADTYNHTIRRVSTSGTVTTLAGSPGNAGNADGIGPASRFKMPYGVAVDGAGNVFVADAGNATIRKITPAGAVTTFAGAADVVGRDDGPRAAARFGSPAALAIDRVGNLIVYDFFNSEPKIPIYVVSIRRIATDGTVTTLADSSTAPALAASSIHPAGVAVDAENNVYATNPRSRVILRVAGNGVVTTVTGKLPGNTALDGPIDVAQFVEPMGLAADGAGNLFVTDHDGAQSIRRISAAGVVTTIAGALASSKSADGTDGLARFDDPRGMAFDRTGNLFVADRLNSTIRKITREGVVTTVAGLAGSYGSADGIGGAARFRGPAGLAVDRDGNLIVADLNNHNIRKVAPNGAVTTVAGGTGEAGYADGVGRAARFNFPWGVASDDNGNIFWDGNGRQARFGTLYGIAVAGDGSLFVADADNNTIRRGTPLVAPVRLVNVSVLAALAGADDVITLGAIVGGMGSIGTKPLLVRAAGPSLDAFGVTGLLADPKLDSFPARRRPAQTTIGAPNRT